MKRSRASLLTLAFVLPSSLLLGAAAVPQAKKPRNTASSSSSDFNKEVAPVLKKYCVSCHSGGSPSAGILLTKDKDSAGVLKNRKTWEAVSRQVAENHMPPQGMPQPTQAERDRITHYIDSLITNADCKLNDPGHVTLRRLNREEYDNTIRDLLGVETIKLSNGDMGRPADDFPSDDVGYGFDNIGDVLSISPLLMEKYVNAADRIVHAAILSPEQGSAPVHLELGTAVSTTSGQSLGKFGRALGSNGEVTTTYEATRPGEYNIRINAYEDHAGPDFAHMDLKVDGQVVRTFEVKARRREPGQYDAKVDFKTGPHKVGLAFTNDYYEAPDPATKKRAADRNLYVAAADVIAPPGLPETLPATHKRIMICKPGAGLTPEQAARKILTPLASNAYRRPVTPAEVARLLKYVHISEEQGESFERGIQVATEALLCSPNFLFRVELDPHPNDKNATRLLNDYELASRLSYFLWSTMPDATLLSLAGNGTLHKPQILTAQVKRMLKDPKSRALADNFAGQWLQLRNLANVAPDPQRFPEFNAAMRTSMKTETEMFFEDIVTNDRSILDFLDGKFTYLNAALAKHYGITGVEGDNFRRVNLVGDQRGGLLTQASVLTVTSNPTRTSPVKRGKWVLEQLLGTPPPPAPPDVPKLADDKKEPLTGTLRQRMEQHRKNAICASCHAGMDPLGFGLENFDPVGKWRDKDGDNPVDASGKLPNGQSFNGPAQLKAILKAKKNQFATCLSEKMLTYALGRGLENYDKCNVSEIINTVTKNDYRFSSLVTAVVMSDPFRKRRGDGGH